MSEHAVPDESNPPAHDGLIAYVAALGVAGPDAAAALAAALRERAAEENARPAVGDAIAVAAD